jgi:hypothetical protein
MTSLGPSIFVEGIPEVLHIAITICSAMSDADHVPWRKACWKAIAPQIPMIASHVIARSPAAISSENIIAIFESTLPLQRKIAAAWPGEQHCEERNMFLGCMMDALALRADTSLPEPGPFGSCVSCVESMDTESQKHQPVAHF